MNADTDKGLHPETNYGIPSINARIEQKNKLVSGKELAVASEKNFITSNTTPLHEVNCFKCGPCLTNKEEQSHLKISDNKVLVAGDTETQCSKNPTDNEKRAYDEEISKDSNDKISEYHTEIMKFKAANNEEFSKEYSDKSPEYDTEKKPKKDFDEDHSKEFSDKSPEYHIDLMFKRASEEEFLKDTGSAISEKLPNELLFNESQFERIYDNDKFTQSSVKSLEQFACPQYKPQDVVFEQTLKVTCVTDREPCFIPLDEPTEKKLDIYDIVGSDGLWQRCIFSWKFCLAIPTAFHYLVMTFLAPDIDYWCGRPTEVNWTINDWKTYGLPEDKCCSRYNNITNMFPSENFTLTPINSTSCDAWEYDTSFYTSTVVSQWDLVCSREWLASFSLSMFNIGTLISNIVMGHLADVLGRKRIIVSGLTLVVFSALASAFSTSYTMFVVTRFLTAFGLSGVYNVSYVLLLEITGPKERTFYGVAMNFGWCIGFITLPGVAWLLRDWFWIEIAITLPCVLLLLTCWLLPESPRWLMVKGRTEEAEEILIKSAKINGRKISHQDTKLRTVIDNAEKAHKSDDARGRILDLICTPTLWRNALNIWFLWFANSFIYHGLSYTTNALAGDPFLNFSLSGFVEAPACIISIFLARYIGKTKPIAYSMITGGLACLFICILPKDPWWLSTALSMIGKCSVTVAVNIAFIKTAEIFPTAVRNAGIGSACFFQRLSSILAPFVKELGASTLPIVPQIIFGGLGCLSGLLVFLLPETKETETLKEAITRRESKQTKDNENFPPVS